MNYYEYCQIKDMNIVSHMKTNKNPKTLVDIRGAPLDFQGAVRKFKKNHPKWERKKFTLQKRKLKKIACLEKKITPQNAEEN